MPYRTYYICVAHNVVILYEYGFSCASIILYVDGRIWICVSSNFSEKIFPCRAILEVFVTGTFAAAIVGNGVIIASYNPI